LSKYDGFFGDFLNFTQFCLNISAKGHLSGNPWFLLVLLTPLTPLGADK
jgi:hypothetical protein